ncbi:protocatechuate 3,4-dioxygenase subunit alpha [Thalassobellus suaedae]|uniref:Protocatechuate 3,4-dioxygenase subunit alpha n=1 Tax=Thalassobellus suaedae TaxID=3074124 RepID=A0ABY9Y300_9FLAO|nr:protocatechuate 3,4-dioxygenase subunit alpha [Flavobacteriaceae bacterium HL-DH10]
MTTKNKISPQTPSQTVGPYFAYGLTPEQYGYNFKSWVDNKMVDPSKNPNAINIFGKVYDGEGNTINDAMIELWQNDGEKKLFGRYGTGTDEDNQFSFSTIKPKSVDGQAPYINVILYMRGQLLHSYTRIYFSDEQELNQTDSVLNSIPNERRDTIIAKKTNIGYEFNIYMQDANETVFFKI